MGEGQWGDLASASWAWLIVAAIKEGRGKKMNLLGLRTTAHSFMEGKISMGCYGHWTELEI